MATEIHLPIGLGDRHYCLPSRLQTPELVILQGDALECLRNIPDCSIQCCVTSPPYWGLRDYGCEGQIGLESTPEEFISKLVAVFAKVRRVLKDDGTCWVNMGDCYAGGGNGGGGSFAKDGIRAPKPGTDKNVPGRLGDRGIRGQIKAKDLVGQPWMLAFALRADGWYLRKDIIWAKSNPMPESCTDRPTTAHEYIFLLSKSRHYFYDAEAIKEPVTGNAHARGDGVNPKAAYKTPDGWDTSSGDGGHGSIHRAGREKGKSPGANSRVNVTHTGSAPQSRQNESFSAAVRGLVDNRNKRSVWTVATSPYPEAHFATFPAELITPCILAGTRPGDIILDPFGGSGTTGMVALQFGRSATLIELNAEYVKLIHKRCAITPGLALESRAK